MTKVTAAMALKAAAMPAAAPICMSRRWLLGESAKSRPRELATVAQICTVGSSRPSDEPVPIWSAARMNFAAPSRRARRPMRAP